MERNFGIIQSDFAGVNAPVALAVDEAYLNGCFSELSFQTILQPLCPYDAGQVLLSSHSQISLSPATEAETTTFSPATYDYFNQEVPAGTSEPPNTFQFLRIPKTEVLNPQEFAFQLLKFAPNDAVLSTEPLINFFSSSAVDVGSNNDVRNSGSFSFTTPLPTTTNSPQPKFQTGSLNDIFNRVDSAAKTNITGRHMPYKSSELARQRRQRISEKTRCLQKILPWDKKMDTGTMLEEAYKYIKFLQAQIRVLETMPVKTNQNPRSYDDVRSSNANANANNNNNNVVVNDDGSAGGGNDVVWGELGKLSRQQLLEVVVNSPVTQTLLYSRGLCVYSVEQLVLLHNMAHKKALLENFLLA
ncbi:hypothetical protein ACH5RR_029031 [Cinchona calisaya]|uniref:BHLH domain-containing protein n=1 Tax=Cinchona calisaya TaxID=153742 RepID=A0ABD2YQH3_9GENT